jgi:hypothetical protein
MTDLVYLYQEHSGPEEIRYSLRSMQKHLSGIGKVFIVGDDPGIFKDVIFIPCENKHRHNGARNIYEKIVAACRHPDLSPDFVVNSDDYFLLRDFETDKIPYFHCGTLTLTNKLLSPKNYFKIHVENTLRVLTERGLPENNFNIHFPIIYNKEKYLEIMGGYDWEIPRGYISKSLYTNSMRIEGELMHDTKIHAPKTKPAIYRMIKDKVCFSTNNPAINDPQREVWQELYPEASRWEL